MKTGLLNKRIEILGKQAVTDEYGFDTQADVVVYCCWASIEPARGKVFYEMERKADTEYSKITIRWRPGVTHDMKVKYQDHLYDIDTIVDPYMRHEALEPVHHLLNNGHVKKTPGGRTVGYYEGRHYTEKSVKVFEARDLQPGLERLTKKLLKKAGGT